MERRPLVALLAGSGEANEACREALHRGADFTITPDAMPASHFAAFMTAASDTAGSGGTATLGFRQGVERLQAAKDQPVCLGWVDVASPPYHFQLFLAEDLSAVLACVGVDQARQRHRGDNNRPG